MVTMAKKKNKKRGEQGIETNDDFVKQAKEAAKKYNPDLAKAKYRIRIGKTIYYPRSENRYRELVELKKQMT